MSKSIKLFLALAVIAFVCPLTGQSQVTTGWHRVGQILQRAPQGGVTAQVVPYATVQVLNTATGVAQTIYSDPLLASPISGSYVTADQNGNYNYYVALGTCSNEVVSSPGNGRYTTTNICAPAVSGTITGVVAGNGLAGGGTSGSVTVALSAPVSPANGGTGSVSASAGYLALLNGFCLTPATNYVVYYTSGVWTCGPTVQSLTTTGSSGAATLVNGVLNIPNYAAGGFPIVIGSTSIAASSTTTAIAGLTLTSPTFTTPALGTPVSGVLTNTTGLPLTTGVTGVLPIANGGTGTASPGLVGGTNVTITGSWPNQTINSTGGGSGTVTTFSAGSLSPLFTSSVATPTSTPALTFTLSNAAQNAFLAGPASGTGAPTYRLIGVSDFTPNSYIAASGSVNALVATLSPAATSLAAGLEINILPNLANTTTTPTINVNGLGAKTITKQGTSVLAAGDLSTTAVASLIYDGTEFQLQNPQTTGGGGSLTGSGTTNFVPLWTGTTALGNSHIDDGATTAGKLTMTESVVINASGVPTQIDLTPSGTSNATVAGAASLGAPTAVSTAGVYQLPAAPGTGAYTGTNSAGIVVTTFTPFQGTDTNLLTAGVMTGSTGAAICKDANGGATTSGCPSSGGTVNSGTAGQVAYYGSSGTAVSGTSGLFVSGNLVGVNDTAPLNQLDLIGSIGVTGSGPATLTTSNGAFTSGATTLTVVSTTGYPTSGVLLIGQSNFTPEILSYTGTTATTFTGLTRSLYNTTASTSQATGTTVSLATTIISDSSAVTPKLMCFWKGSCIASPITANLYNGIGTGTGGFGSGQTIFATTIAVGGGGSMANMSTSGTGLKFSDSSSTSMGTWLDAGITAAGVTLTPAVVASPTLSPFTFTGAADTGTSTVPVALFQDTTGNTRTGPLVQVNTVGTSTALPLQVTAQGTANGVQMSASGTLSAIGTGGIVATSVPSLSNVTNNAQTQAAIVPNTAPTAGQVLLGNAGGTAYAPVSLSQDCTVTSAGVVTCLKTNNTAFTSAATTAIGTSGATIPLLNAGNTFSAEQIFSTSSTGTLPGTLFSGLASTTTPYAPVVDIFASGATAPTRSATGTILELNAASGFTGQLISSFVNGVASGFYVNYSGSVNMAGFTSSSNGSITGQLSLTSGLQALSTEIPSNNKYGFSSTTANNGTIDTVICRGGAAGVVSLESASTCTNTVAGGTATVAMAVLDLTSAQTTVSCSTSGSAIFSEPFQGPSDKKVLIHLAACLGTASYTYPTAFTNTPSCYASVNVACTVLTSTSTTAVTVTGATTTGSAFLEDY